MWDWETSGELCCMVFCIPGLFALLLPKKVTAFMFASSEKPIKTVLLLQASTDRWANFKIAKQIKYFPLWVAHVYRVKTVVQNI